jgi:hypothetical protein
VPNWSTSAAAAENDWSGPHRTARIVGRLLDQYTAIWRSRIDQMAEILAESQTHTEIDAGATPVPAKPTTKEDQA